MFTTELNITNESVEKFVSKSDGLGNDRVTKSDTKLSCYLMPGMDFTSEESECWTFEEEGKADTEEFRENLQHSEVTIDILALGNTVENVKAEKMNENSAFLRTKSQEFLEDQRELTASYSMKENIDVLLRQDKDSNGNFDYFGNCNANESSDAVMCDNSHPRLTKPEQNGLCDGIPVVKPHVEIGTNDPFEVILSTKCQNTSYDDSVTSAYRNIKQVGYDMCGYVTYRDTHHTFYSQRQFDNRQYLNELFSHDSQRTRNIPQDYEITATIIDTNENSLDNCFSSTLPSGAVVQRNDFEIERVNCSQSVSEVYQEHGDVTALDINYRSTSTVPSQAESLQFSDIVQEDEIVPVTLSRQPVCCSWFEESIMTREDNRRSCVSPDEWSDCLKHDYDDDDDSDEKVESACLDKIDNSVETNNTRLAEWHAENGCYEDDAKWSVLNYHSHDLDNHDDRRQEDVLEVTNNVNDSGSCHGNALEEYETMVSVDDTEGDDDGDDDDDDDITRIEVNGGNPFDLDESEFQKLMQSIDNSSDSISDENPDDYDVRSHKHATLESWDSLGPQLSAELTKNFLYEQNNISATHENVVVSEMQIKTPFDDEFSMVTREDPSQGSTEEHDSDIEHNVNDVEEFQGDSKDTSKSDEVRNSFQTPTDNSSKRRNSSTAHDEDERDVSLREIKNNTGISELKDHEENSSKHAGSFSNETMDNKSVNKDTVTHVIECEEVVRSKNYTQDVNLVVNSKINSLDNSENEIEAQESVEDQLGYCESKIQVLMEPHANTTEVNKAQSNIENSAFDSQLEQSTHNAHDVQLSEESELLNTDSKDSTNNLSLQERIQNVNKAFEWVRKELQTMKALDFNLKVQFDGLRQEVRTLREEYESYVNCEYYDDDEIFDEATEYMTCQKESNNTEKDDSCEVHSFSNNPSFNTGLREDSGYHSDTPSSSTDAGSIDNEKPLHTTHAQAKYYYQPLPTYPKIQELRSSKCVFELVL